MNNLLSLILALFFLAGCGRKSDPTPEIPDSFPRTYPNPSLQSLNNDSPLSGSESSTQTSAGLVDLKQSLNSSASNDMGTNPKPLVIDIPRTYSDSISKSTNSKSTSVSYAVPDSTSRVSSASLLQNDRDVPRVGRIGDIPGFPTNRRELPNLGKLPVVDKPVYSPRSLPAKYGN